MLSKNLENSTSYDIFFYKFWKKARVYYTLSISRGGGAQVPVDSPLGNGSSVSKIKTNGEYNQKSDNRLLRE